MKDFPELENKIIEYRYDDDLIFKVKVVGCNYDVGITIKSVEFIPQTFTHNEIKKDEEVYCLNGKSSPNKFNYYEDTYDEEFYLIVDMIKKGIIDCIEFVSILEDVSYDTAKWKLSHNPNKNVYCAYGI